MCKKKFFSCLCDIWLIIITGAEDMRGNNTPQLLALFVLLKSSDNTLFNIKLTVLL